ncbi:MAG: c-type cytochrome [Phycisphaerales bacterium]|nr:c-type cytochrome [Phycisphaerales bacterium]MCB9837696.1 c-type cytochrome [Phycisphaera sp.]
MTSNRTNGTQASLSQKGRQTKPTDPYRWHAIGVSVISIVTIPLMLAIVSQAIPTPPEPAWSAEATSLGVQPLDISRGEVTYRGSCALCHGPNGEGMHLLGKPLRNSAFVQSQSDDDLLGLLINGRPINDALNTSGALMPPRGAQNVDDERLARVVLYLRAIQDKDAPTASTEAWNLKDREDGAGSVASVKLEEHAGFDLFIASCSACHGEGAQGIENQGLPLTTSGFVRGASDKELITFIKSGRPVWDANNTTGVDMPPKGGNPAITDEQLQAIVEYIRAVQKEATGT